MNIICEECGKLYQLSPDRVKSLNLKTFKTKCKMCGHIIIANLDEGPGPSDSATMDVQTIREEKPAEPEISASSPAPAAAEAPKPERPKRPKAPKTGKSKTKGIGLRGKMAFFFLVIPITLMAISGYISQMQMETLADSINKDSVQAVRQLGEENIGDLASAVAKECKIYLDAHPQLDKEEFYDDDTFRSIGLQRVGKTGYTVILEMAEKDEDVRIWIHENPVLIGIPAAEILREALGQYWPEFYKILAAARVGDGTYQKSEGYYNWLEEDGSVKEKYMSIAPIEGTNLAAMATTYIDEFTYRIKALEAHAKKLTHDSRNFTLGILLATLVIIVLTIFIYGHRITMSIQHLTDAADRISVGELDTEIQVVSKDEIGSLAEAIARMQDSLRLSIERLRRRR